VELVREIAESLAAVTRAEIVVDKPALFPIVRMRGLAILVIPLRQWDKEEPGDDYLQNFLDERKDERWIILWEDIWRKRRTIAQSRLLSFTGISERIHGRKCTAAPISHRLGQKFLNENHLMGYTKARYNYALYDKSEPVAIATFGRSVPVKRGDRDVDSHELIRFCHKAGYHVSGGLTKLLSCFRKDINPEDIFTSVDREWSSGSGYAKTGFREIGRTSPICFYIDKKLERHRNEIEVIRICNAGNIRMALTYT